MRVGKILIFFQYIFRSFEPIIETTFAHNNKFKFENFSILLHPNIYAYAHREISFFTLDKLNSDCNYTFLIDLMKPN